MSAKSHPVRLDPEITASAKSTAAVLSRSLAEQISHWARIGRELERSPDVSVADIRNVLGGKTDYDALPTKAQAVVRAAWVERMTSLRASLRLDQEFRDGDYRYAELGADGAVVVREPPVPNRPQREAKSAISTPAKIPAARKARKRV